MPSLKSLRVRIKSVKNTQQITKTMKMVAAAKMRRAQSAAERARPYADTLGRVLQDLARNIDMSSAPLLLKGRTPVKTVRLLVFGSDRGLCGAFNGHLVRLVSREIRRLEKEGQKVQLVCLGRKARDELRGLYGKYIVETFDDITRNIEYAAAETVGTQTIDAFVRGDCDEVYVVFNTFINVLHQEPTLTRIIPFSAKKAEGDAADEAPAIRPAISYEPEEEVILKQLLPLNVSVSIFRALLESQASEQGARMSAMDSATRNAGEMIGRLTTKYNRQRQANITSEITEIVAGAEAV